MQELGCPLEETAGALHCAGEEHSPASTLGQTDREEPSQRLPGGKRTSINEDS